jgi:isopenicillin-N epimerase
MTDKTTGFAGLWDLDPRITYLNHGSFGACPQVVLEEQNRLRGKLEANGVHFIQRQLMPLLETARSSLANFVGASSDDLVFVPNATTGVNSVLRSLQFDRGDEILITDHEYNACRNAVDFVAQRAGATVVTVSIPLPVSGPDAIVDAVMSKVSERTTLAMIDHITSPTAIVFPVQQLVAALDSRGIDTLVDGAHAMGMVELNLNQLGAAYYTGNCHKWLCAPKGSAMLHVRIDRQDRIRPLAISHGANSTIPGYSRFHLEFDWTGTHDPTPYLSIPAALRFMEELLPGGWPELMRHNRELAIWGRQLLTDKLDLPPVCPDTMIGAIAAVELPPAFLPESSLPVDDDINYEDRLEKLLYETYRITIPVIKWPAPKKRLLRVSAQMYNERSHYETLVAALDDVTKKQTD